MALIRSSLRALARCLLSLACIAAATLSPFAQAQPPARAPFPWIDIHLHLIGGPGVGPYVRRTVISLETPGVRFTHEAVSVFSTFEMFKAINPRYGANAAFRSATVVIKVMGSSGD